MNTSNMQMQKSFPFWKGIFYPILCFALFTPWSASIDLFVSNIFFSSGNFTSHPFWDYIYNYGIWPAWLLIAAAFAGLGLSILSRYRSWRLPCIYLILTLAIGSGLIIHLSLKEHWGRPRPRQIEQFGGKKVFQPYYQPNFKNQDEPAKSFSCGHCSMGFYFISLALLGKYLKSRTLYILGMSLAFTLGILLSLARLAQGGHFFSDVLATALIMWLTAWILGYFLLFRGKFYEGVDT